MWMTLKLWASFTRLRKSSWLPGRRPLSASEQFGALVREYDARALPSGEVAFHPLFELPVPELSAYEARLLPEMLRRFPKSGSAREWFFTTERDSITELTRTLRVAGSVGI